MQKGLRPRRSIRMAMAHEILFYAIVQKDGLGFDKAVEEAKARMARYQVTPNMLVVPPQVSPLTTPNSQRAHALAVLQKHLPNVNPSLCCLVSQLLLYMAVAPEEKIKFNSAGPAGPARFDEGVAGYEARAFRGLGVFSSSPYEVNDDTDSVQMLQRSTQVGEFYRMAAPKVQPEKLTKYMYDIVIYDEEMDKHVHITIREALAAAMPGGMQTLDPTSGVPRNGNKVQFFGNKEWMDQNAKGMEQPKDGLTADTLATELEEPKWMAVEVIVARPFIEHLMMSAIMTVAGRDTGATLFGPADMQISANTSVKTIEGHYTCHTKSVITKPQNVLVLRDIMCSGYVAGGNTRFFGEKDARAGNGEYTTNGIQQAMTNRLSFVDDASGEYESMLAFAVPYGHGDRRDQVYSISARLLPWEVTRNSDDWHDYFPGGNKFKHYELYSQMFGLGQVHFGEDIRAAENMEFISQGSANNALCFVGPHRVFSQWSQTAYELVPGQGHFGPDALPGVSATPIPALSFTLCPYTFTTQHQLRFRGAEQHTGLMCTKRTRAGGALWPRAACSLQVESSSQAKLATRTSCAIHQLERVAAWGCHLQPPQSPLKRRSPGLLPIPTWGRNAAYHQSRE
jgi:hypothetical protein